MLKTVQYSNKETKKFKWINCKVSGLKNNQCPIYVSEIVNWKLYDGVKKMYLALQTNSDKLRNNKMCKIS